MKKLVLILLLPIIFSTHLLAQDFILKLKSDGREKSILMDCPTKVKIAANIDERLSIFSGTVCRRIGDSILIVPSKIVDYERLAGELKKIKTTDFTNVYRRPIAIHLSNIEYFELKKWDILKGLHVLTMLGSGLALSIVNPLLSYNFESNQVNANRWLNAHLISLGVLTEGILFTSLLRDRRFYLKPRSGKRIWEANLESLN